MSSNSPTNSLGVSGLPPMPSSPRLGDQQLPAHDVPSVNVEAPSSNFGPATSGGRTRAQLGSSASEPQVTEAHSYTFPGIRGGHSARSSPGPSEVRNSTESNSPPRRTGVFDSPKLRGIRESLTTHKVIRTPASDPGHISSTNANRSDRPKSPPRWPIHGLNILHLTHSRSEPFVPPDPYAPRFKDLINRKLNANKWVEHTVREFILTLMLRLPSTYFSRVARVFRTAELSRAEVDAMIRQRCTGSQFPREWNESTTSKAVLRFRNSWDEFLRSLEKEWKTLNIVSALLTTGIISMFQITDASNDIVTRTFALISLISAVMSLIYGCTLIIAFATMKGMHKAIRWAEVSPSVSVKPPTFMVIKYIQNSLTKSIFWNVWVLLATPAIWLAYSMMSFCVAILAFVWTTGTKNEVSAPSNSKALAPRILISLIFAFGMFVYIAVIQTFKGWADNRVYVRNPADAFDHLENGYQDIEMGNPTASEARASREGEPRGDTAVAP